MGARKQKIKYFLKNHPSGCEKWGRRKVDDRPRLVPPATARCSSYGKNQILTTAGARERPRMAPRTNRRPHYKSPQRLPTPLTLSLKHAARAVAAGWRSGWVAAEPWRSRPFRLRPTPWRLPGFWRRRGPSFHRWTSGGTGGEGGRGAGRAGRGERDKGGSASSNRNTQRTSHGGACVCGGGTKTTNNIK